MNIPFTSVYGDFQYNNKRYLLKLDALKAAKDKRDYVPKIIFSFHDEIWSSFDWKYEPEVSLDYLYAARAKQLREKYNYVVLKIQGLNLETRMGVKTTLVQFDT